MNGSSIINKASAGMKATINFARTCASQSYGEVMLECINTPTVANALKVMVVASPWIAAAAFLVMPERFVSGGINLYNRIQAKGQGCGLTPEKHPLSSYENGLNSSEFMDVIRLIFFHLSIEDKVIMKRVCKSWNLFLTNELHLIKKRPLYTLIVQEAREKYAHVKRQMLVTRTSDLAACILKFLLTVGVTYRLSKLIVKLTNASIAKWKSLPTSILNEELRQFNLSDVCEDGWCRKRKPEEIIVTTAEFLQDKIREIDQEKHLFLFLSNLFSSVSLIALGRRIKAIMANDISIQHQNTMQELKLKTKFINSAK